MRQAYVIDTGGENYIIMITGGFVPIGSIGPSPLDNGVQVTDIDYLDILDVDDGFGNLIKTPILNPTKKADKQAANQAKQDAKDAAHDADKAKRDNLKALKNNDLNSLPKLRDALIEVMEVLGLR